MAEGTPGSWVRRAAAGDQTAWGCLVERYNAMLWSIARSFRLSLPDGSDVVQTTWLRLVEHLDRINEPDRIGSWLATTARNECLVHLRRQGRQGVSIETVSEVVDGRATPGEALLRGERDEALWAALGNVSSPCRQLLRILAGDPPPSYQEVSAVLDIPVGSIGPTRARCLEKLRQGISAHARHSDLLEPR
jgi:RNA polymerase sigma factor (sigma-70 family)